MTKRSEQIQKILREVERIQERQALDVNQIIRAIDSPSIPFNVTLEHKPMPRPHLIIPSINRTYPDGHRDVYRLQAQQVNEWENLIPLTPQMITVPDGYSYDLILNYQWSDQR